MGHLLCLCPCPPTSASASAHHHPPLCPKAYSNPACTHSTLSRTSTWTRTRAWSPSPSPSPSPTQQLLLSSLFVMLASCDRHNFSFFSSNIRTHIKYTYACIYKDLMYINIFIQMCNFLLSIYLHISQLKFKIKLQQRQNYSWVLERNVRLKAIYSFLETHIEIVFSFNSIIL